MFEYVFDYLCDDIGLDEQNGLAGQETDPITILLIYGTTFIVLVNTATSSSLFNMLLIIVPPNNDNRPQ